MREGWVYKMFEDCLVKATKAKQVQTSEYNAGSKYPIISQEDKMVSGYCDDSSLLYHIDDPVVIFGDHTRVLKYVDFDFVVGADGVKILIPKDFLRAKYLLYYLRWYKVPSLGYSRHYKLLKEIQLPVPPLSEQQRIVSELDLLSSIIEKKKAQLKEYDQLAQSIFYDMFGDPVTNEKGWEVKKLGEVCEYAKTRVKSEETSTNNYVGVDNLLQNCKGKTIASKVPVGLGLTEYWKGDVLIGNIRPYLKKNWLATENGGCNGDVLAIRRQEAYREAINTMFLFKCLSTDRFFDFAMQYAKGEKMPRGDKKEIMKYLIPLPPLPLQQSFASKIEAIERQKSLIQQSITEAETLFNSRMDYWFS